MLVSQSILLMINKSLRGWLKLFYMYRSGYKKNKHVGYYTCCSIYKKSNMKNYFRFYDSMWAGWMCSSKIWLNYIDGFYMFSWNNSIAMIHANNILYNLSLNSYLFRSSGNMRLMFFSKCML